MEPCSSCKALALAPHRLDIPLHLVRLPSDEPVQTAPGSTWAFRCNACASRWKWAPPATWLLTLPVNRTPSPKERALQWWRTEILPRIQKRPGSTLHAPQENQAPRESTPVE